MARPRALAALCALATLAGACALAPASGATMTSHTANATNRLTAADTPSYLGIWSQTTDPNHLTGFATQGGSSGTLAATGSGDSLSVNLGTYSGVKGKTITRAFTLTTPTAFPAGVTSESVTLSATADSSTGAQPLSDYYFADTSDANHSRTYTSLGTGVAGQVDVVLDTRGLSGTYTPHLIIQVTYSGYTGGFLSYQVPVKVTS